MTRVTAVPRFDSVVALRDGRSLAYAEWGDPLGRPVVLFHGQPGSRLLCPDADATESAGVRLITVDRPGYGRSDPESRTARSSPGPRTSASSTTGSVCRPVRSSAGRAAVRTRSPAPSARARSSRRLAWRPARGRSTRSRGAGRIDRPRNLASPSCCAVTEPPPANSSRSSASGTQTILRRPSRDWTARTGHCSRNPTCERRFTA